MQLMTFNSLLMFDIVFVFFLFLVGVTCLVYYLPPKPLPDRHTYDDIDHRLRINLNRSSTTLSAAFEMENGTIGNFTCNSQSKRLAMHHECDSDLEPNPTRTVRAVRFDRLPARVQLTDERSPRKSLLCDPSATDVVAPAERPPAYEIISDKHMRKNTATMPIVSV